MTVGRMVEEEEEVEEEERGVSGQPGSSRATRRNPLSHPPPPPSNPSHPDDPANPLLRPPHPLPSLRPIQTSAHFSTFASFSLPAGGGWWSPIQRTRTHCERCVPIPGSYGRPRLIAGFHSLLLLLLLAPTVLLFGGGQRRFISS